MFYVILLKDFSFHTHLPTSFHHLSGRKWMAKLKVKGKNPMIHGDEAPFSNR